MGIGLNNNVGLCSPRRIDNTNINDRNNLNTNMKFEKDFKVPRIDSDEDKG